MTNRWSNIWSNEVWNSGLECASLRVDHYMGSMIVGMSSVSQVCQINDGSNLPVFVDFLPLVNGGLYKDHIKIIIMRRTKRSSPSLRSGTFVHFIRTSNLLLSFCSE